MTCRFKDKARMFIAAVLLVAASSHGASAQFFPDRNGYDPVDPVTGYLCITPGCDVVRLPNANCICKKENPNERNLGRLLLTCTTREGGAWVACPSSRATAFRPTDAGG
jgi:hypothetical protein